MNKLLLTVVLSLISGFCFGWESNATTKVTEVSCEANEDAICAAHTEASCSFTWKGDKANGQSILLILLTAQASDRSVTFRSKKACQNKRIYGRQEMELSSVKILKD